MNQTITDLLKGKSGDNIFPFFWLHGEEEEKLREMMKVIHDAGCKSVCLESRPHPDFCGEKWWRDLDIILDEARKRDMKVWILDDSHFPTGFANGGVKGAPVELHRQSVVTSCKKLTGKEKMITLDLKKMFPPRVSADNFVAASATKFMSKGAPVFDDDKILSLTAVDKDGKLIDMPFGEDGKVFWHKPQGTYKVYVTGLSRNMGIHREYINMMDKRSCRILIDEVYEKHYEHYKDDFGKTILGFFSDEPELGNGFYMTGANRLGTMVDQPYSQELEEELKKRLGETWKNDLVWLWDNDHPELSCKVRLEFMDAVTKLVREDFSKQIADWCHEHGVRYIGHLIEDNNSHTRTGMSLGHYFRGLNHQDMAGIDDIGGQVLPQGEDLDIRTFFGKRDGEFFHFALGNLAASAAAIEPNKHGDSMCEIFGNYGWKEGVRLEKYLADHFLVRGINHFVPHAFTGKDFPDPDCPPHFYAWGNNPQYRHFSKIVEYMNRVTSITSGGQRMSHVAVLYNAEEEWMDDSMLIQKPLRKLYEAQILADTIPADVFKEKDRYHTVIADTLKVNEQDYEVLIVPGAKFIDEKTAEALDQLNIPVLYLEQIPEGIEKENAVCIGLDDLIKEVERYVSPNVRIDPASKHVRVLEYEKENRFLLLFNEDSEVYEGRLNIDPEKCYEYDAWENRIYPLTDSKITLEPNKMVILVFDEADEDALSKRILMQGERHELSGFLRSVCTAKEYPHFHDLKDVTLPDDYAKSDKYFSGLLRYEKQIHMAEDKKAVLEITDAYEGVEVFLNGESLGIQVVPGFRYELPLKEGDNSLVIEVATTLERQMVKNANARIRNLVLGNSNKPRDPIGISGKVYLYY